MRPLGPWGPGAIYPMPPLSGPGNDHNLYLHGERQGVVKQNVDKHALQNQEERYDALDAFLYESIFWSSTETFSSFYNSSIKTFLRSS